MNHTEPTINAQGDEVHPSYGVVRVNRVTSSPSVRLFDSSVPHQHFVKLEIATAVRKRDLHSDRIHGNGIPLVAIEMSLSQWGSLVSSFGQGSGTPVTLTRVNGEQVPETAHESRLAHTAREVAAVATASTEQTAAAVKAVEEAFDRNAGRKEMRELLNTLHHTIGNLPRNMKFAADVLTKHAEDVVEKAKTDIEAALQFGGTQLAPEEVLPELPAAQS